jgi:hypothetical protein
VRPGQINDFFIWVLFTLASTSGREMDGATSWSCPPWAHTVDAVPGAQKIAINNKNNALRIIERFMFDPCTTQVLEEVFGMLFFGA